MPDTANTIDAKNVQWMLMLAMNKKTVITVPLVAAWGINAYLLSLSRTGVTLIKLSMLIFLGPFVTIINGTVPLYGYFIVSGFSISLLVGVYFCVRKISLAKSIVAFFLLFCWFFIAVLYMEIGE